MGRRAKYFTLSERSAAAAIHKQRYNATESGRTRRSAQNSRMYQQNHPSIALPALPCTLVFHSKAFLRRSSLFDLYHQMIDTDPCTIDLRSYTHLSTPGYNLDQSDQSEQALLDLLHSVNGRQLNLLEADGERRYAKSLDNFGEVTKTARDDFQHLFDAWSRVETLPWPEDDGIASMIHGLSLEWGARVIIALFTELEVRQKGFAKYQSAYRGRKLWWQQINVL